MQRRTLLLAGIVSSFRLPRTPAGGADAAAAPAGAASPDQPSPQLNDLVFRRVMALPKGRKLLARCLLVLTPLLLPSSLGVSPVPNLNPLQLLWATLRAAGWLFGASLQGLEPSAERALAEATGKVAAAAGRAIEKLREPGEVTACLQALGVGLQQQGAGAGVGGKGQAAGPAGAVLPLVRTRRVQDGSGGEEPPPAEWLGEVVVKLMTRAEELGLGAGTGTATGPARERWFAQMAGVVGALAGHLEALAGVHAAAAAAGNAVALAMVSALAAKPTVASVAAQAPEEGRGRLRSLALALGA